MTVAAWNAKVREVPGALFAASRRLALDAEDPATRASPHDRELRRGEAAAAALAREAVLGAAGVGRYVAPQPNF